MISDIEDLGECTGRGGDERETASISAAELGTRVVLHGRLGDVFAEMIADGRACAVACGLTEIGALVSLRQKLLAAYSSDSLVIRRVDDRMRQILHLTPQ
jgi:hypothetical protein